MKCTQCGCKTLIKTHIPLEIQGDAWLVPYTALSVYACLDCGHLELFDKSASLNYTTKTANLDASITKLNETLAELSQVECTIRISEKECKDVEMQLSNLDITIRQQQELKLKLSNLQQKIRNYQGDKKRIEREIGNLRGYIKSLQDEIKTIIVIEE